MTGYHISSDGKRRPCNAKTGRCRYGAQVHFSSVSDADDYISLMKDVLGQAKPGHTKSSLPEVSNPLVNHALHASLGSVANPPAWWSSMREQAQENDGLACEPELLDIMETSYGPVAVIWQPLSQHKGDRSVQLRRGYGSRQLVMVHVKTGKEFGHLRLGSVDVESIRRAFGDDAFTPFRFSADRHGHHYAKTALNADLSNMDEAERIAVKQEIWVSAHQDIGARHNLPYPETFRGWGYQNLSVDHAPTDETNLDSDLERLSTLARKEMNNEVRRRTLPLVDYSDVQDEYRGIGLGSAMYVYAARRMAKENLALRASDSRTDEALAVWSRFEKHLPEQTRPFRYINYKGEVSSYPMLDFR